MHWLCSSPRLIYFLTPTVAAVNPLPRKSFAASPIFRSRQGAALRLGVALILAGLAISAHAERTGQLTPDFQALAKNSFIRLPPPPAWPAATPANRWTIDDLRAAFDRATDTPPRINHVSTEFVRPPTAWMDRFKTWFGKLEKPLRLRFENQQWDCDNYANCFVTFADLLALRAGESQGTLCVGWATVYYQKAFAGIAAGGAHAVVIVGTTDGLFIIEPQDGTMIALEKYPNRNTIEAVYF